jgi:surface polysaccharide O-acyltransferase-like enzyme
VTQAPSYGRLDYARFAAALSIVALHAFSAASIPVPNRLAMWATPFFLVASGLLSAPRLTDAAWLRSRLLHLVRLAIPWLVLGRVIQFVQNGAHYSLKQLAGDIFIGAAWGHLWFLPALFLITLLGWVVCRLRLEKAALVAGLLAALAVYVLAPLLSDRHADYLYRTPFPWFVFFMVGVCWMDAGFGTLRARLRWGALPGLAFLVGAGWLPRLGESVASFFGRTLIALAVAGWALDPKPRSPLGRRLGEASLGIYLIHPFIIALLRWLVPGLVTWGVFLWLSTALVSLGLTLLLLRLPVLRRLVS